jgi:dTDP-4-amino-4,6-dideoxygalactose transaminase
MRYVRNHGEVGPVYKSTRDTMAYDYTVDVHGNSGILGYNFRMTEIAAAFAQAQWKKLDRVLEVKRKMVSYLIENLANVKHVKSMIPDYDHVPSWYNFPLRYQPTHGVSRKMFVDALNAEGLHFACGYGSPLYKQEIYTTNKHWVIRDHAKHIDYSNPACPIVERLYNDELITTLDIRSPYDMNHMKRVVEGIRKVSENIKELI